MRQVPDRRQDLGLAPAPVVVAAPVMYAPAPVMYAPAYPAYPAYAAPGSLSIGLNVPLR